LTPPAAPRRSWLRWWLVQALQVPAVALLIFGAWPAALWCAALWGSVVCCGGTDSQWRWRNRLLLVQASAWLSLALVLGWRA